MKHLPMVFRHSTSDALKLAIIPMDCAERLRDGTAEDGDWDTVVARLNIGLVLARWFYKDHQSAMGEALDIIAVHETLTPEQHLVVGRALQVTTAMEGRTTRRELTKAIQYAFKIAAKKEPKK